MNNSTKNNFEKDEALAKEKKMADAEKKSAIPILSVGITWLVFAVVFHIDSATKIFLVAVMSFVVYQIVKKSFPPKKIEIMMEAEKPAAAKKPEKEKKPLRPFRPRSASSRI